MSGKLKIQLEADSRIAIAEINDLVDALDRLSVAIERTKALGITVEVARRGFVV